MKESSSPAPAISLVYITIGTRAEALALSRFLLEKRLVACVNIVENICSLYEWEGQLQETQEWVIIAKTRRELFEALKTVVLRLHTYDCPAILEVPVERGNPDFLQWIHEQTTALEPSP